MSVNGMTTLTWVGFASLALFYATGTLGSMLVSRTGRDHAAVLVWRWSAVGVVASCVFTLSTGG